LTKKAPYKPDAGSAFFGLKSDELVLASYRRHEMSHCSGWNYSHDGGAERTTHRIPGSSAELIATWSRLRALTLRREGRGPLFCNPAGVRQGFGDGGKMAQPIQINLMRKGVLKPRHFLGVRLAVMTMSWISCRTLCRCRSDAATSVVIGRLAFSTPPFCHEA
jgi:hypothetical protein